MAMKVLWIFVRENSENLKMDITWYPITIYVMPIHFTNHGAIPIYWTFDLSNIYTCFFLNDIVFF